MDIYDVRVPRIGGEVKINNFNDDLRSLAKYTF